jgi:hypothetical protein
MSRSMTFVMVVILVAASVLVPGSSCPVSAQGDVIQWRIAGWSLDELRARVRENRYVRNLTCDERAQYGVEPLCK